MKNGDSLIDSTTSEDQLLDDILTIHNISRQLTPRLKIFNEIMNVWPDCIDEIRRIENLDLLVCKSFVCFLFVQLFLFLKLGTHWGLVTQYLYLFQVL